MDFLDPKKRRAHRIKLLIGYCLMTVALAFASVILLYQSYGYDYDPETGQIVQNGLIFIDAHPDGANVYLNGESKGRTDLRLDVRAGDYTLELQQPGYHSWKRDFTLEGRSIERFLYPFLFPADLQTSDAHALTTAPGLVTQSPNRQWLVIQQPGSFERFDLLELSDDPLDAESLTLPAGVMTTAGDLHELSLVEWSTDNRRFVLRHRHSTGEEFILVDIESPGSSVNLTRSLATPFTNLALRDKKYDQYYLHNTANGTLYTARLTETTPTVYQQDVLAFRPHGSEEVAFMTATNASTGKVWLKIREGDNTYAVREIPASDRYVVDLARFEGSWYVAAGSAAEDKVYLFKNPVATIKRGQEKIPLPHAILRTPAAADFISFSANTRFIASQSGSSFAVYDAETNRQYRYDTGLSVAAGQKVGWMDGHRLTAVIAGKTTVWDYDGTNRQTLTNALDGYLPFFERDYEALFTLSPSVTASGQPALVRTELRVD